mgnify:CR=1 FL=1
MNITKMVKDGVNSIGDTINPFPKKIEVVVKFDIAGTYSDMLKAIDGLTPERMVEITEIVKRKQRQIMDLIEKEDKWGYSVN